jgi:hypothetical protein
MCHSSTSVRKGEIRKFKISRHEPFSPFVRFLGFLRKPKKKEKRKETTNRNAGKSGEEGPSAQRTVLKKNEHYRTIEQCWEAGCGTRCRSAIQYCMPGDDAACSKQEHIHRITSQRKNPEFFLIGTVLGLNSNKVVDSFPFRNKQLQT